MLLLSFSDMLSPSIEHQHVVFCHRLVLCYGLPSNNGTLYVVIIILCYANSFHQTPEHCMLLLSFSDMLSPSIEHQHVVFCHRLVLCYGLPSNNGTLYVVIIILCYANSFHQTTEHCILLLSFSDMLSPSIEHQHVVFCHRLVLCYGLPSNNGTLYVVIIIQCYVKSFHPTTEHCILLLSFSDMLSPSIEHQHVVFCHRLVLCYGLPSNNGTLYVVIIIQCYVKSFHPTTEHCILLLSFSDMLSPSIEHQHVVFCHRLVLCYGLPSNNGTLYVVIIIQCYVESFHPTTEHCMLLLSFSDMLSPSIQHQHVVFCHRLVLCYGLPSNNGTLYVVIIIQ